eukprot:3130205-Pyramimonas_sp.AAC.1
MARREARAREVRGRPRPAPCRRCPTARARLPCGGQGAGLLAGVGAAAQGFEGPPREVQVPDQRRAPPGA